MEYVQTVSLNRSKAKRHTQIIFLSAIDSWSLRELRLCAARNISVRIDGIRSPQASVYTLREYLQLKDTSTRRHVQEQFMLRGVPTKYDVSNTRAIQMRDNLVLPNWELEDKRFCYRIRLSMSSLYCSNRIPVAIQAEDIYIQSCIFAKKNEQEFVLSSQPCDSLAPGIHWSNEIVILLVIKQV